MLLTQRLNLRLHVRFLFQSFDGHSLLHDIHRRYFQLFERRTLQRGNAARLAKLEIDAQNWRRAQAIREYLNALEQGVEQYELTVEQRELLRWGRAKADWIDPLKPGVVDVLDEEIVIPK